MGVRTGEWASGVEGVGLIFGVETPSGGETPSNVDLSMSACLRIHPKP